MTAPTEAPTSANPGEKETGTDKVGLVLLLTLLVALGVWGSWAALVIVLALVVVIFLHELGHYLTARWAGMKVTEFFLGFGPKLWSFHRGDTEYGIKAIPAGAYVRIIGMHNLEEVDPAEESHTYRAKSTWRRLSVAAAGSTVHFLLAIALAFGVFVGFGTVDPESDRWTALVQPDSPADEAGLEDGDRFLEIDGMPVGDFNDASVLLRSQPGATVDLLVERDGRRVALTATLDSRNPAGEEVGYLGVGPQLPRTRSGVVGGFTEALAATRTAMWQSVTGLGNLFSPEGLSGYYDHVRGTAEPTADGSPNQDRPTSIVGIVQVGSQIADDGWVNVLFLFFVVNVFIGVFNLVPLLPFDGGHVVIALYEKARSMLAGGRRYQADVSKLMPLTYAVVAVLAVLFVSTLYLDVVDPVSLR